MEATCYPDNRALRAAAAGLADDPSGPSVVLAFCCDDAAFLRQARHDFPSALLTLELAAASFARQAKSERDLGKAAQLSEVIANLKAIKTQLFDPVYTQDLLATIDP